MSNENSLQSVRKVTQQDFIESILNLLFHYLHIVYMYTIHTYKLRTEYICTSVLTR